MLAAIFIGGILYAVNFMTGYPFSIFTVQKSVHQYMEEQYGDTDFTAGKPERNLKQGGFTCWVSSDSDPSVRFYLDLSRGGTLRYDSYEFMVGSGMNTALELSRSYGALCWQAAEDAEFPLGTACSGSFEPAIHNDKQTAGEPGVLPDRMDLKGLDPDMDLSLLSPQYGTVVLEIKTDAVTPETARTALLKLRECMENAGLPFCSCEVWILPGAEEGTDASEDAIHILNFGWDDIYEDGLEERVVDSIAATDAFYK